MYHLYRWVGVGGDFGHRIAMTCSRICSGPQPPGYKLGHHIRSGCSRGKSTVEKCLKWSHCYSFYSIHFNPQMHAGWETNNIGSAQSYFWKHPPSADQLQSTLTKSFLMWAPVDAPWRGTRLDVYVENAYSDIEFTAFRLLSLMKLTEVLREMFHPEMGGLQMAIYQLTRLLTETHPSLYTIKKRCIISSNDKSSSPVSSIL